MRCDDPLGLRHELWQEPASARGDPRSAATCRVGSRRRNRRPACRRGGGAIRRAGRRLLFYPFEEPGDRPIPWLFRSVHGDWILNVDDDEVPSAALLDELPQLIDREDFTHAWIARKWLYPDPQHFLSRAPVEHGVPAQADPERRSQPAVLRRVSPAGHLLRADVLRGGATLAPRHCGQPARAPDCKSTEVRARAARHADRVALAQHRLLRAGTQSRCADCSGAARGRPADPGRLRRRRGARRSGSCRRSGRPVRRSTGTGPGAASRAICTAVGSASSESNRPHSSRECRRRSSSGSRISAGRPGRGGRTPLRTSVSRPAGKATSVAPCAHRCQRRSGREMSWSSPCTSCRHRRRAGTG